MKHPHKTWFYLVLTLVFVASVGLFTYVYSWVNERPEIDPEFGVTFSTVYAQQLDVEPTELFDVVVNELGVEHIRLPIYWSEVEHENEVYDWGLTDHIVQQAELAGASLTVVVGMKVPRWPECYIPDWAETESEIKQHKEVLSFIEQTVLRYKDSKAVVRWQVENEPFFPFGECPTISVEEFRERVELVRSLDDKPIQVTVSGELGPWLDSAQSADILGISLYRQTWNDLFGYFVYPLSPEYYLFRTSLIKEHVPKVVVSELQAEPWFYEPIESKPVVEWYSAFPVEMLEENIEFAKQSGLSEVYLWGVEWWYVLNQEGESRLWETAQELFKS